MPLFYDLNVILFCIAVVQGHALTCIRVPPTCLRYTHAELSIEALARLLHD